MYSFIARLASLTAILNNFIVCSNSDSFIDATDSDITYTSTYADQSTIHEKKIFADSSDESDFRLFPSEIIVRIIQYLGLNDTLSLRAVCWHLFGHCDKTEAVCAAVEKCCIDMEMNFQTRVIPDFGIKLRSFDRRILFKSTEQNLGKLLMALERKLVETLHFFSFLAYENFGQKFLLEEVFVKLTNRLSDSIITSSIDFQFVDQLHIIIQKDDAILWLQNESLFNKFWKNLSLYIFIESSSCEAYEELISRLNFEALQIEVNEMSWSELLKYLTIESREKIRVGFFLRHGGLPTVAPDVGLLNFRVSKVLPIFIESIESLALLEYIRKRPALKVLELNFYFSYDFDICKSIFDEYDISFLDREFRVILTSGSSQRAVFHFSPIQ